MPAKSKSSRRASRHRRSRPAKHTAAPAARRDTLSSLREELAASREATQRLLDRPKPPLEELADSVDRARQEVLEHEQLIGRLTDDLTNAKGRRNAALANHQSLRAKFAEASLLPNKVL